MANLATTAGRLDSGGVWELDDAEALAAAKTLIEQSSPVDREAESPEPAARTGGRSESTGTIPLRQGAPTQRSRHSFGKRNDSAARASQQIPVISSYTRGGTGAPPCLNSGITVRRGSRARGRGSGFGIQGISCGHRRPRRPRSSRGGWATQIGRRIGEKPAENRPSHSPGTKQGEERGRRGGDTATRRGRDALKESKNANAKVKTKK